VPGSEPEPSVSAPQAGSTAQAGSGWEGIYESSAWGYTFIVPGGKVLFSKGAADWTWGSIAVSGVNWSFNPDTYSLSGGTVLAVTGSGTFTPKTSMQGSYSKDDGRTSSWGPLTYSTANALAVTLANLRGKWSVKNDSINSTLYGMSVEFDANGMFTGTTSGAQVGVCKLSGSVVQVEPGTSKNLFYLGMDAVNAAAGAERACQLDTTSTYYGLAAIVLTPAGTYVGNGYFRTFTFHALTDNIVVFTNHLRKEQ
jgi:hypothetical protein